MMGDSYKAFEDWINGMTDDMYEDWLEDTATEAQEEKALNIRTPLSEQEEEDIESQQVFVEQESGVRTVDVGDNRDLPIIRRPVILETQATQPPRIVEPTPQERVILTHEKERVPLIRFSQPTQPVTVQKQQSRIRQVIAGLRARLASILRRNRKPNA